MSSTFVIKFLHYASSDVVESTKVESKSESESSWFASKSESLRIESESSWSESESLGVDYKNRTNCFQCSL